MNDFMRMLSDAFCLPITTFASGVETAARAMQHGGRRRPCGGRSWGAWERWDDDRHDEADDGSWGDDASWDDAWAGFACVCGCGCDRCRRGDCCRRHAERWVKLVEWSLVRVTRGGSGGAAEEDDEAGGSRVLLSGQSVVAGETSPRELRNEILVDYVREHPEEDGKNLRVFVRVLARYRRPGAGHRDELHDTSSEAQSGEGS